MSNEEDSNVIQFAAPSHEPDHLDLMTEELAQEIVDLCGAYKDTQSAIGVVNMESVIATVVFKASGQPNAAQMQLMPGRDDRLIELIRERFGEVSQEQVEIMEQAAEEMGVALTKRKLDS